MSKHTPGPWHTGPTTLAGDVWVYKDCFPIAEPANFWNRLKNAGKILLCRVRGDVAWKHYQETKTQHEERYWATVQANARLMAAAPDLLASLEAILEGFDSCPENIDYQFWVEAHESIAKAKAQ